MINNNNGYTGITVSFHDKVTANVVRETEKLLRETSELLYNATDNGVFFQEVTFIFAKSVNAKAILGGTVNVEKTRIMTVNDADFVVLPSGKNSLSVLFT
jgi:hypothetical protein